MAIAYDEGKLIGVLKGTGGISDLVADILKACAKETGATVIYEVDPQRLVEELLRVYRATPHLQPSCFCADRPPGEDVRPLPGMEIDPVCGMALLPQAAAAERTFEERRYLFCSTACVERFDADPRRYLREAVTNA